MHAGEDGVVTYVASRFDRKVILPIASLVIAATLMLAGVLWWSAAQQNVIALRDEEGLLATALDARREREAEMLYDYAFWDEAYEHLHVAPDPAWALENIAGWAHERLGVGMTFILDPAGRAWLGTVDGVLTEGDAREALGEQAWRHVTAVRETAPDRARAALVSVGGRLAVVAAAPVGTHTEHHPKAPGPPSAIVQVNPVEEDDLAELARTYLLPELRLVDARASAPARFAVTGPDGRAVATLAWRSSAPGSDLLSRVLPVFGLMASGIAVLTLVVLRHARDAAATIASSERRASHDPLTGLANRRLLEDRVAAAFAAFAHSTSRLAMLYVDLDGFKLINDRFGHEAGDELLREVGRRLRRAVRASDTVARLGGDEFAILQVAGTQPSGAARLAEAIVRELSRPVDLPAGSVQVGASVGIALTSLQAITPRELARRADAALYAAKNAGRGTYRFFDRRHLDATGSLILAGADE